MAHLPSFNETAPCCMISSRLPPEIWEEIFSHVTNCNDLLCIINVSSEWRDILSARKSELFPLLFKVPSILSHLPLSTLLTCRRLNRKTNAVINSILQSYTTTDVFPQTTQLTCHKEKIIRGKLMKIKNCYVFESEDQCRKFVEKMGHCEIACNPFILGCVQITPFDSHSFSFACSTLISMFQKFGKHVFSLRMKFSRSFSSQVGILLTILELVPNLQHLQVETLSSPDCFFISWPFHFEEIYEWIQKCELPCLMSLNVKNCKTCIGLGGQEYWDDWEFWKNKPRTVEGALFHRFQKQLKHWVI